LFAHSVCFFVCCGYSVRLLVIGNHLDSSNYICYYNTIQYTTKPNDFIYFAIATIIITNMFVHVIVPLSALSWHGFGGPAGAVYMVICMVYQYFT